MAVHERGSTDRVAPFPARAGDVARPPGPGPTPPSLSDEALQCLLSCADVEQALESVLVAARDALPHIRRAGLSLIEHDGTVRSRLTSDDTVTVLEALQRSLGEGPSHDAVATRRPVIVDDLAACGADQWPLFVPIARHYEVATGGALHLVTDKHGTAGVLTLYSEEVGALDATGLHTASLIASHAALTLHGARRLADLTTALRSRDVIGQAKGILMERRGLTEEQAFDQLVVASQDTDITLRDVAAWLIDDTGQRGARSMRLRGRRGS